MLAPATRDRTGRSIVLVAALGASLAAAGCSSRSDEDRPAPAADAVRAADASAAVARPAANEGPEPAPAPDEPFAAIGVEPCDRYIGQQRQCVSEHAPETIREQQLDGLAAIAARWREVARAGSTEHLVASCEHLLAASAEATTSAWKCKW
jgi:hypothetical protein